MSNLDLRKVHEDALDELGYTPEGKAAWFEAREQARIEGGFGPSLEAKQREIDAKEKEASSLQGIECSGNG